MRIIGKKKNVQNNKEAEYLNKEIEMTKRALQTAYSNFDNATDPELIDCFIYQLNSEQQRYQYLLQKAKEYDNVSM